MKAGVPRKVPACGAAAAVLRQLAHAGNPEVENLQPALAGYEQIVRFDVAVNDALLVSGSEHVQELVDDRQHLAGGKLPPLRSARESSVSPSKSSMTRNAAPSGVRSSSNTRTAPEWSTVLAT